MGAREAKGPRFDGLFEAAASDNKQGNVGAPAKNFPKKKGQFYFLGKHALRVRGRKQGLCRPWLGGRHLHCLPGRVQESEPKIS